MATGVFDYVAAAHQLIDTVWFSWESDPSILLLLVIHAEELHKFTSFGKNLWSCVSGVVGSKNMKYLPGILEEVRKVFLLRQQKGESPGVKGLNTTGFYKGKEMGGDIKVWEGRRKEEVIAKMRIANKTKMETFCMAHFVCHDKRRFFRGYLHPQDMVRNICKILTASKCPYTYILEVPVTREGAIKLYFDVEYYLSKMLFIDALDREKGAAELLEIADMLPAVLSRGLVAIKLVSSRDTRQIIVKDNSRVTQDGDYKVARHFVFDILLTSSVRDAVMENLFGWIKSVSPMVYNKIHSPKATVSVEEYSKTKDKNLISLVGIDPASKSSLQMLRFAWTKKSHDCSLLSLHSVLKVCNGEILESTTTTTQTQAYTATLNLTAPPNISVEIAAASFWDSCISIPSPMCVPVNKYSANMSRKRVIPGDQVGSCKRSKCGDWNDIKCNWFTAFCKRMCNDNLPSMRTNVQYARPPQGFEDGLIFQINGSNINFCAMAMMEFPVSRMQTHKSNGTVFCVQGDMVLFQCLDPVCINRLKKVAPVWKKMCQSLPHKLQYDDRLQGLGNRGWWARLPMQ